MADAPVPPLSETTDPHLRAGETTDAPRHAEESLSQLWPALTPVERRVAFDALKDEEASDLFLSLSSAEQARFLEEIDPGARRLWARILPLDDAADVVQHLPEGASGVLLDALDPQARAQVQALLAYREDAAGGLMDPRYAVVRLEFTAEEALTYLRRQEQDREGHFYYTYVLGADLRLRGVVTLRELLRAPAAQRVADIMVRQPLTVRESTDQEEVARLMARYDLLAIPVVDERGRMKGIVTIDDVMDVVTEEATEDIHKLGGSEALDAPYLDVTFRELIQKRAGWLTVLFVGEMLTATAMGYFEAEIEKAVVLALFIPLIISSGGNAGSQASTLIVRALAVGDVHMRDFGRVLRRELASGLCLGLVLAAIGFLRIVLWPSRESLYGPHFLRVGAAVSCSLIGVVLWGTVSGAMMPFFLRRAGFDPASASAPFVATLVDVTGLVIYFSVATTILNGVVM